MTTMTQTEQLWLEMTNRARLDPAAEAARLGITLNTFLPAGANGSPITGDPREPLAGNNTLQHVAENHAGTVLNKLIADKALDFNAHDGAGDGTPMQRIHDGGYAQNALANGEFFRPEAAGWANTTFALTQAQLQQMVASNHDGLFIDDPKNTFGDAAGHRLGMLATDVKEVGVGTVTGTYTTTDGVTLNNLVTIENYGASGSNSFLTGAVYNDTVIKDHFYSLGEAVSGVTATVTNASGATVGSDTTGSGGGWSVAETGGTFKVTFSGPALAHAVSATVAAGTQNAKVDLVNGTEIDASASTVLGDGAKGLRLLGMVDIDGTGNTSGNTIIGNTGDNHLAGKGGHDVLTGGLGDDTFVFNNLSDSSALLSSADRITDFHHTTQHDLIDLHLIDAVAGLGGDQAFTFIGNHAYGHHAGELRSVISGADTRIFADVNGDGHSEFSITLSGHHTLHADDFIL
jgi:Ca2+-binding RTX toxin-like protein